jgi:RNA polymerase sigma factor (sigma-70 family)
MTRPVFNNQPLTSEETWTMATQWVSANRKVIRQIASPYFKFMVGDYEDLYQEATIAIFKALVCSRKKRTPEQLFSYFRVIFKTSCIKMASGIQTVHCLEDYFLPWQEKPEEKQEPDSKDIEKALTKITARQREICLWLLQQPTPVNTFSIAAKFKITKRQACRLVASSIANIQGKTP